jgi:small subunit ribosomal protein S4e
MTRGPKKHLKRIAAPRSWLLAKTGGTWATRPSSGPHRLRESIPLGLVLRHRLRYALSGKEATTILKDKEGLVKVDHKVRADVGFPCGVMDVITLDKANEQYRVLYDVKGRFILKSLKEEEAKYKLCKIKRKEVSANKIPYIVTHDGRTFRFPNPEIEVNDTVKLDLSNNKIVDVFKFEQGNLAYAVAGNNIGRVGVLINREHHNGGFDIVHVKDNRGVSFATRIGNIFIIGKGKKSEISLPPQEGIYLNALELREKREKLRAAANAKKNK